jgi:hypothetical protein
MHVIGQFHTKADGVPKSLFREIGKIRKERFWDKIRFFMARDRLCQWRLKKSVSFFSSLCPHINVGYTQQREET